MKILNEKLSISDVVNDAYSDILDIFKSKMKSSKIFDDWRTGIMCQRVLIPYDLEDETIYIEGTIYYPKSYDDIKLLRDNDLIYYKFNTTSTSLSFKGIKISTYFYNQKFDKIFYESLQHELNHAYQDIKGFVPKNSSYDRVTSILNLKTTNNNFNFIKVVAFIEYCNHKFEQDSIVNGYYRRLINEYSDEAISFAESIEGSTYQKYQECVDIYNDAADEDIDNVMKRLNLNKKDFEARMTKMDYRFRTKIHKVYKLYLDKFNN